MEINGLKNFKISVYSDTSDCKEKVIIPTQVHGNNIVEIISGEEDLSQCDGLITFKKGMKLGIRTADCAAVCIGDGNKIGIIHIGWRGLIQGVYEKAERLFSKGHLEVFVGPFLHRFEIKRDFCFDQISARFGNEFFIYENGKIVFDFKSALSSMLPANAVFDERDTELDLSLPSNRRNGTEKRILTVVSF